MPRKKPLYAPMLATFGGGSVKGFNSGGGGSDEFFSFSSITMGSYIGQFTWNASSNIFSTNSIKDIIFSAGGNKCFICPYGTGSTNPISEITMSTPYDLRTTTGYTTHSVFTAAAFETTYAFSEDGLHFAAGNRSTIYEFVLTSPYNLGSVTASNSYRSSMSTGTNQAQGCGFNKDGSLFWVYSRNTNSLRVYNLSTAFKLDTASANGSYTLNNYSQYGYNNAANIYGHHMSADGKCIATVDSFGTNRIRYHNLGTAYNFNTISANNNITYDNSQWSTTEQMALAITPNFIYFADSYDNGQIRMFNATVT